ncbi:uncharacterized protein LOC103851179 isoform X2 [Brassica rapa]|uniref:(rape) hypothetical protein n=1 Tax=Brassica napus TaxID=3708 RepID=A0A078J399_BRANA|nr:uncharacterized protein LOC103851179 isoform X2 [Brassica rapa]CAF2136547.1 unnamed protein product [Brassica napus]CDY58109.1 BnaA02g35110D [Brassica napus]
MGGGGGMEELTEDEKRALRGSKFAPLTSLPSSSRSQLPRLAHPGGPLKTNKAAALAKFLERKLQDPNGLSSIDPDLIELAVKNAKDTVISSGASSSGRRIQHVAKFEDVEISSDDDDKIENTKLTKKKKKKNAKKKKEEKKKKKNKKHKIIVDDDAKLKRPNKKLKL